MLDPQLLLGLGAGLNKPSRRSSYKFKPSSSGPNIRWLCSTGLSILWAIRNLTKSTGTCQLITSLLAKKRGTSVEKLVLLACYEELSRDKIYYKKFTQREMFFDNLMKEEFSRVVYYKVTTLREEFFEDHI